MGNQNIAEIIKTMVILLAILLLFFGSAGQMFLQDYFVDPDSYYHARMVNYLLENGSIPEKDPQTYYYLGGAQIERHTLLWDVTAIAYNLFYGTEVEKHRIVYVAEFMMLVFGTAIILLSYFATKEFFGRGAGYLSAFLVALMPGIAMKLNVLTFEDDVFGLIPLLVGLIFVSRWFKEKDFEKRIFALFVAGISFGAVAWIWEGYAIIVPAILLFALITVFLQKLAGKLSIDSVLEIVLFISTFFCTIYLSGANFLALAEIFAKNLGVSFQIFVPQMLFFVLAAFCLVLFVAHFFEKHFKSKRKIIFSLAFYVPLILAVLGTIILLQIQSQNNLHLFIAEENNGIGYLIDSVGVFLIFPIFFLFLYPLQQRFLQKEKTTAFLNVEPNIVFLFSFAVISGILAIIYAKYVFIFALFACICAGFAVQKISISYTKNKGFAVSDKKRFAFVFVVLLFGMFFSGFSSVPFVEETRFEVVKAFNWARENTPADSSILVWWDYGHIASFFSDKKITNDNKNWKGYLGEPNKKVAQFFISQNVGQSFNIASNYFDANYVFIDPAMFTSTFEMKSLSEGKISDVSGFFEGAEITNCQSEEQCTLMESRIPFVIKKVWSDSNTVSVYRSGNLLIYLSPEINSTVLAQIYFNSETTQNYFEEVYFSGIVKLFKIKK